MSLSRRIVATILASLSVWGGANATPLQDAQTALARQDYGTAVNLLNPLVAAGNVDALGYVANMHAMGLGVAADPKRAYDLWLRASNKRLSSAMYNIALLHEDGAPGIAKDPATAAKWYMRAAEHRHVPAMLVVSTLYATGRELPLNKRLAIAWASLAESNARELDTKRTATRQFDSLAQGLTRDDVKEIQLLMNDIAKMIDDNINQYRAQQTP
jgi:TPR repeat protein